MSHDTRAPTPQLKTLGLTAALTFSMGIGPLLVYALTAMGPLIILDLGLSRAQFGLLATVTFVSAALASTSAGIFVDGHRARLVVWVVSAGAALSLSVAAAAPTYAVLVVAVVVSGLAQSLSNPVTNRLATLWVPPRRRGMVMGVKQSGVQLAQALAGLLLPGLALLVGWQAALLATAGVAIVGAAACVRFIPHEAALEATPARRCGARQPLPLAVWWLAGFAFLGGAALQAGNVYLPLYGNDELGLSVAAAGLIATVVGTVGLVARIGWGPLSHRLGATHSLVLIAGGAALGVALVGAAANVDTRLIWVGAALFGATGVAANVVLMVAAMAAVPAHLAGRASGLVALGMYLGFATGPISFGALVDLTGDYRHGWIGVAVAYLLALLLVLTRPDWDRADASQVSRDGGEP